MKRLLQAIYPIGIYISITYAVSLIGLLVVFVEMSLIMLAVGNGFDQNVFLDGALDIYNSNILFMTFISAVASIPLLGWFYKRDVIIRRIGWQKPAKLPKYSWYAVLFGICICLGGNTMINLVKLDELAGTYQETAGHIFGSSLFLQLIGVSFVIPAAEELTFRALCFRRFRDFMGFWKAALLSSLLFGLFHGNLIQGIYAFVLGIGISYTFESYHTLWAPILVHSAANLASVVLNMTPLGRLLFSSSGAMAATFLVSAAAAVYFALFIYKRVYHPDNQPAGVSAGEEESL